MVDVAFQAAGVVPGHLGLNQHSLGQGFPVAHLRSGAGERQLVQALLGLEFPHDNLDHGAGLGRLGELPHRQAALLAAAELDEYVVAADGHHSPTMPGLGLQEYLAADGVADVHQLVQRRPAQCLGQIVFHFRRGGLAAARPGGSGGFDCLGHCAGRSRSLQSRKRRLFRRWLLGLGESSDLRSRRRRFLRRRRGTAFRGCGSSGFRLG